MVVQSIPGAVVTTLAGVCQSTGGFQDGPAATAQFSNPHLFACFCFCFRVFCFAHSPYFLDCSFRFPFFLSFVFGFDWIVMGITYNTTGRQWTVLEEFTCLTEQTTEFDASLLRVCSVSASPSLCILFLFWAILFFVAFLCYVVLCVLRPFINSIIHFSLVLVICSCVQDT